jgi:hypothetical protein
MREGSWKDRRTINDRHLRCAIRWPVVATFAPRPCPDKAFVKQKLTWTSEGWKVVVKRYGLPEMDEEEEQRDCC